MSTGLTWVTLVDVSSGNPQLGTTMYQFSDYSEAYNFGDWYIRLNQSVLLGTNEAVCTIYTTSPNPSGYWLFSGGEPTFFTFE